MEFWNKASPEERKRISDKIAHDIVKKLSDEYDFDFELKPQFGGFMGFTNASYQLTITPRPLGQRAGETGAANDLTAAELSMAVVQIAKSLGFVLNQDSIALTSAAPFDGSFESGEVTISLGADADYDTVHSAYLKLRAHSIVIDGKAVKGEDLFGGHSTVDGQMMVLNFSDFDESVLERFVHEALPGKAITSGKANVCWVSRHKYGLLDEKQQQAIKDFKTTQSRSAGRVRNFVSSR